MSKNAKIREEARAVTARPPAVILCEPQLGENIGTAARAMANFGLADLRIVNPRDGWPSEKARAAASRADHVIDKVQVFDSVEAAIADLQFVYATTARSREVPKPVCGPDEAARKAVELGGMGHATGYLFGRERWGLNNEEVALADAILTLPVDPDFCVAQHRPGRAGVCLRVAQDGHFRRAAVHPVGRRAPAGEEGRSAALLRASGKRPGRGNLLPAARTAPAYGADPA
ncbi:RNA methyltransferase [Roseibium salinum]|nr:RNA methyltransferase [Roseibium salinum]